MRTKNDIIATLQPYTDGQPQSLILLSQLSDCYMDWQEACRQLAAKGLTYETAGGLLKASPYLQIKHQAITQIRALIKQLFSTGTTGPEDELQDAVATLMRGNA